jgi:hypothetical protein
LVGILALCTDEEVLSAIALEDRSCATWIRFVTSAQPAPLLLAVLAIVIEACDLLAACFHILRSSRRVLSSGRLPSLANAHAPTPLPCGGPSLPHAADALRSISVPLSCRALLSLPLHLLFDITRLHAPVPPCPQCASSTPPTLTFRPSR